MSYRKRHVKSKVHKLKPKRSILKSRGFWLALLFVVIVFGVAYLFLFLPQIQIKNVEISGNQKIKTQDLQNIVEKEIVKKITRSIFLADTSSIQNEILVRFPAIGQASVTKKLPDTLNVVVQERQPVAIFENNFVDEDAVSFESYDGSVTDFTKIKGQTIDKNILDTVLEAQKVLKENYNIDTPEANVASPVRLDIKTSEGWQVYLNLQQDTHLQIAKLNILLKDQILEPDRKKLQYIDMRFKDKAYYK